MTQLFYPERASAVQPIHRNDDFVVRYRYPLDHLMQYEERPIVDLARYWDSLASPYAMPSPREIDSLKLCDIDMLMMSHLIDVTSENPEHFNFMLMATNMTLDGGRDYTDVSLGEYPDRIRIYSDFLQEDYAEVKRTGKPAYHQVCGIVDGTKRGYTRLILPLANDGRRVDHLLIGVRFEKIPLPC